MKSEYVLRFSAFVDRSVYIEQRDRIRIFCKTRAADARSRFDKSRLLQL